MVFMTTMNLDLNHNAMETTSRLWMESRKKARGK